MKVRDRSFAEYISSAEIQSIVGRLAADVCRDYAGRNPYFLVMMNGAFVFAADFLRKVSMPCSLGFVKYTSYEGMKSTGVVTPVMPIPADVKGRDVVILEDIVDTGITMDAFLKELSNFSPASVSIVSFLTKPQALQRDIRVDYVGKPIDNLFVVGYGLDYDGAGRTLDSIYILDE